MQKKFLGLLLCLLLTGCGLRLTYNQLDWLGPWYVRSYVALNTGQKALLKERWNTQLAWHRQTQLPRYAIWLRQVQEKINRGLRPTDLEQMYQEMDGFYRVSVAHLAPDIVALAKLTSRDQVNEFMISLQKENRQWHKKHVKPKATAQHRRRVRQVTDNIVAWTGPLHKTQRHRIEAWSQQLPPMAADMLRQREHWQDRMAQLLVQQDSRGQEAAFDDPLTRLVVYPDYLWTDRYRARIERHKILTWQLLADLAGQLTERQREHLNRKIDRTVADLLELSGAPRESLLARNP